MFLFNGNNLLTPEQKKYSEMINKKMPKPHYFRNGLLAFLVGGLVCVIGQVFLDAYAVALNLSNQEAANPAVATMIFIGALLTGLGLFDKIARYGGAGLTVPVTGFANAVTSAALEFKKEGFVQGVGSKMFILAGSVITFGVLTAFFVGLFYSVFIF